MCNLNSNLVTLKFANAIISNFRLNQLFFINEAFADELPLNTDSLAVDLDFKDLQDFVFKMSNQLTKLKILSSKVKVRFYFVAYPSQGSFDKFADFACFKFPFDNFNRLSILAMPALNENGVWKNWDFYNNREIIFEADDNVNFTPNGSGPESLIFALNHGNAIPPY